MDTADRSTRLLSLLDAFGSKRVLVVGDLIADEFIYGEVSRVSRGSCCSVAVKGRRGMAGRDSKRAGTI